MPAPLPTTAQQFRYSSDFPVDKIIYRTTASQSIPTAATLGSFTTITIAHGLPFTPMCFGSFSDDGFATSYEFGNYARFFNATFAQYTIRISAVVESDATNVKIYAQNMLSTRTFDFRIVALAPTTVSGMTAVTAPTPSGQFVLNTDYNYMKIYLQGTTTVDDDGVSGYETLTIPHGLGYVPNALVFSEFEGVMRTAGAEVSNGGTYGVDSKVHLTTGSLIIEADPLFPGTVTYHYRVYLDD